MLGGSLDVLDMCVLHVPSSSIQFGLGGNVFAHAYIKENGNTFIP